MSEWLFLGERTTDGTIFQLVMNKSTGQYYRFEPLATKLKGNFACILRQEVESRRSLVGDDQDQAILPVIGPIFNEGRSWLGWKGRNGHYLFGPEVKQRRPLIEELVDLFPLIRSYCLWHQAGLVVGRPEWARLFIDNKGVFMPDPKPLGYLAKPFVNPPIFLERSRPAEEYLNQPLGPAGDIFYLGLITYYFITGESPFPFHKGRPTRAILNGTIFNPQIYRPNIPSELGQIMLPMLVPEPLQRPTIETVKEFWYNLLLFKPVLVKPDFNKKSQRPAFSRQKHVLSRIVTQWVFPVGLLILLIISFAVFYLEYKKHSNSGIRPLNAAANFYQEMERVGFQTKETTATQSLTGDFRSAAKRRLEMVTSLLSKPLFKVDRMKLTGETGKTAIVEADLTWWEWSTGGWTRRPVRERLYFQKKKNQWRLLRRSQLHEY